MKPSDYLLAILFALFITIAGIGAVLTVWPEAPLSDALDITFKVSFYTFVGYCIFRDSDQLSTKANNKSSQKDD